MIRINLLGTTKPKKGKGRRRLFVMPQLTTDGPSPLIAGLAILVLAGAGIYGYHMKLQQKHEQLQADISEANRQITSLNLVKQAYLQRQKDFDAVKRRFDIIDQLRAQQAGPVPLLNTVSETVNATDGVWLLSLKDNGENVALDGVALGPNAVADLMTNLRRTGYFKNIELRDTVQQDNRKIKIETFSFSVVCEKAATTPEKAAASPAKAATPPKA
jgi:type IV pilus assembly protein PilN